MVEDVAREAGVAAIRAPVGEVNVAVRMRDEGAPIGGEGNGGVILPEVHLGRDAPIGAALLLQLLVEEGRPLSQIARSLPSYVIVKDKLARPNASLDAVYGALRVGVSGRGGRHAGRAAAGLGRTGGCTYGRRARSRSCE